MRDDNRATFLAVGDICIRRENPSSIFDLAAPKLRSADILFGQLEQMYSGRLGSAAHANVTNPAGPEDVQALTFAGFDILSLAGNHVLSWGENALLDTLDILKDKGIVTFGAGRNIAEARKLAVMEAKGVKLGLLGYASVLPPGQEARETKPGAAPIRVHTVYDQVDLGQPGTPPAIYTYPYREDIEAMRQDVQRARKECDVLVFSHHAGIRPARARLVEYQIDAAYAAIEAGADLVLNHHAHILKGVEVYKGKPIFYGLGNFAFDLPVDELIERRRRVPTMRIMMEANNWEPDPDYPGYGFPPESRMTLVAKFVVSKKGVERTSFLPAYINKYAQPEILGRGDRFEEVAKYVEDISREAGLSTKFRIDGDEVCVED